jgi:hypothetical protein
MPKAIEMFISERIQLNPSTSLRPSEAAHGCGYRAMGLVWAVSEHQKRLFIKIKRSSGGKKGISGKYGLPTMEENRQKRRKRA